MSRGLIFLYISGTARSLGETIIFAFLPIALYREFGQAGLVVISLISAIPAVFRFAAAQVWGAAIDRVGRQKPFTLIGLAGIGVLLGALAWVESLWTTVALVSAGATIYAAFNPAARTFATLEDERHRTDGLSRSRILPAYLKWESIGWFIGGIVPGFLLDLPGIAMRHLLIGGSALALIVTGLNALFFREAGRARSAPDGRTLEPGAAKQRTPDPDALDRGPSDHDDQGAPDATASGNRARPRFVESLVRLYRRPEFAGLLGILFFTFFARESFFTTYGIYLTEHLGAGTSLYGASIAIATILGVLLFDAASRLAERWGSLSLLRRTATVYALGYAITVAFPHPWVLAGYFALPLFPFLTMASTVAVAQMSAAEERGSGLGILEATDLLAVAIGSISAGVIATRFGLPAVPIASLLVSSLGILAAFGLAGSLGKAVRKHRSKRRPDTRTP